MQKKMCEVCRHPYESEDHLCREAMPASDGGPAFPVSADVAGMEGLSGSALGMTLRDYFAAKSMHGLLANPGGPIQANGMSGWGWCNCTLEDVADFAWHIADAMLRARGEA